MIAKPDRNIESTKKNDVCVLDSDQSGFYSSCFQLSLIQHGKIRHFNMVKNSNTSHRTIIGHAHSFNTEPAAPPGQASLESRFQDPICKNVARGMSLVETSSSLLSLSILNWLVAFDQVTGCHGNISCFCKYEYTATKYIYSRYMYNSNFLVSTQLIFMVMSYLIFTMTS